MPRLGLREQYTGILKKTDFKDDQILMSATSSGPLLLKSPINSRMMGS